VNPANLFQLAEACLYQTNNDEKLALTHQAWQWLEEGRLSFADTTPVLPIGQVQFPQRPVLKAPRDMPRRRLNSAHGTVAFFHAIAHVEFMAVYLAWDIIYRFRSLPEGFYRDWLQVADEEAQHFTLLNEHLQALGSGYGELPAHAGLWERATDTADDLLARLALVPRCMEARGLDVTPSLIEKFRQMDDQTSVAILTRILTDEVGHVAIGSTWFKWLCGQRGLQSESEYQQLITQYYKGGKPKGPFNREMRIIAGFSQAELDWLESST